MSPLELAYVAAVAAAFVVAGVAFDHVERRRFRRRTLDAESRRARAMVEAAKLRFLAQARARDEAARDTPVASPVALASRSSHPPALEPMRVRCRCSSCVRSGFDVHSRRCHHMRDRTPNDRVCDCEVWRSDYLSTSLMLKLDDDVIAEHAALKDDEAAAPAFPLEGRVHKDTGIVRAAAVVKSKLELVAEPRFVSSEFVEASANRITEEHGDLVRDLARPDAAAPELLAPPVPDFDPCFHAKDERACTRAAKWSGRCEICYWLDFPRPGGDPDVAFDGDEPRTAPEPRGYVTSPETPKPETRNPETPSPESDRR